MSGSTGLPADRLVALARARGLDIDAARAETLRPAAESLLGRLALLADRLAADSTPPPSGVDPACR